MVEKFMIYKVKSFLVVYKGKEGIIFQVFSIVAYIMKGINMVKA